MVIYRHLNYVRACFLASSFFIKIAFLFKNYHLFLVIFIYIMHILLLTSYLCNIYLVPFLFIKTANPSVCCLFIQIRILLKTFHLFTGRAYVIVWRLSTHKILTFLIQSTLICVLFCIFYEITILFTFFRDMHILRYTICDNIRMALLQGLFIFIWYKIALLLNLQFKTSLFRPLISYFTYKFHLLIMS